MSIKTEKKLADIFSSYSQDRGNLLPILRDVQRELGYLPEEALEAVAEFLKLSNGTVYSVATFYAQLRLTPPGKNTVRVCRGPACHIRGSNSLLGEIEKRLGVKTGETTADLKYSLETVACSGTCALAPVVEVDDKVYGSMTKVKVDSIQALKEQRGEA